jgi:hypothetical protein
MDYNQDLSGIHCYYEQHSCMVDIDEYFHKPVKVLECIPLGDSYTGNYEERCEDGMLHSYDVEFEDGTILNVFEDELMMPEDFLMDDDGNFLFPISEL